MPPTIRIVRNQFPRYHILRNDEIVGYITQPEPHRWRVSMLDGREQNFEYFTWAKDQAKLWATR